MALVTVYITTCNRLELLKRCLNSIKEQTIRDIEIIVVDDNSNDDTALFMKSECEKDTRIKYLRNDINRGACYSRNKAISVASSEYITGCDDDDYFEKDRIKSFVENSDKLEQFVFLYTDSLWLTSRGVNKAGINKFAKAIVSSEDLLYFNYVGNQVFTKTSILQKYLFDVNLPAWQDFECWFRILRGTNKKALRINSYNYIQDISHPFSRISSGKQDRIIKAYDLFCNKYNLKESE
ncbi:TPA: glycosyltransferase, partial [Klebsiella pneumoniae]|nr:glycosyltransferase [Klebsiella pneumoniae]HBT9935645.1 glycosyltransferase [Klebsiella pneumoniae]